MRLFLIEAVRYLGGTVRRASVGLFVGIVWRVPRGWVVGVRGVV